MLGLGNRTYAINTFSFQITTTGANQSFTLPISGGGSGYVHRFVATWGDGSSSTITSYNSANATHIYASAGTHIILLTGRCEWFAFNNTGDKTLITQLVSFTGDIGFKVLNFYGCSNLNTLVPLGTKASLTTAQYMFYKCTSIASIPSGMFAQCPAITTFNQVFAYCNNASLTTLPADIFRYNKLVTDYSYAFWFCSNLTAIPAGCLGSSVNANTSVMFQNTSIISVDVDAFRYFTGATTGLASILASLNITSVPADLFKYNTLVTSFASTFSNTRIAPAGLPATLFKYNTAVTSFHATFFSCSYLTSIPAHLFDYNTVVTDFTNIFSSNTSMATPPADLFKYNVAVTSFSNTFFNCRFSSVVAGLFQYNVLVTDFSYVFGSCNNLSTLPTDLFRYNTAVTSFAYAFNYCSSLHSLPSGFIGATSNPDMSGIFGNCSITTLNASTFRYFTGATTAFSGLFSSMTSLVTIPAGLFDYNTAVTTFASTFSSCSGITTIPADLFRYNVQATNFSYCFYYNTKAKLLGNIFYEPSEVGTRFLNQSVNFSYCFYRGSFSGVQGVAPDLWNCNFGSGTPTKTSCYGGAGNSLTSLSNYASIPAAWE